MELPMELHVTDLKQWFYCPRVVYWTYCLPVPKKSTYKMEHGAQQHDVAALMEKRRTLRRYGLQHGERRFRLSLRSTRLGLTGLLDLLIIVAERYFPVEFKETTSAIALNHRYQLTGYALLLEETFETTVDTGFIYRLPLQSVTAISITPAMKAKVKQALTAMHNMIIDERMPPPVSPRSKCLDCEYRNYCADVL